MFYEFNGDLLFANPVLASKQEGMGQPIFPKK
jgi:hypothetical protein